MEINSQPQPQPDPALCLAPQPTETAHSSAAAAVHQQKPKQQIAGKGSASQAIDMVSCLRTAAYFVTRDIF